MKYASSFYTKEIVSVITNSIYSLELKDISDQMQSLRDNLLVLRDALYLAGFESAGNEILDSSKLLDLIGQKKPQGNANLSSAEVLQQIKDVVRKNISYLDNNEISNSDNSE